MTIKGCIYFDSDKSVSVLPKSRCILRGPFDVGAEIEIDWSTGRGEKQRHIGVILATGEKGKPGFFSFETFSLHRNATTDR